jgi:hypothetical protein
MMKFLSILLALVALLTGYIFIVGKSAVDTPAAARPVTAPDKPHILYLAPAGNQRGQVNDEQMQGRGATPVRDWAEMRATVNSQPLDALLVDTALFDAITSEDTEDTDNSPDLKYPLVSSFRKARGELNSKDDLDLLFLKLKSEIEDAYQTRQEIQ